MRNECSVCGKELTLNHTAEYCDECLQIQQEILEELEDK